MSKNIAKNILLCFLSLTIFFLSLEAVQRIRYCKRYHSAYWLLYGFVPKPSQVEYYKMQLEGLYGVKEGNVVSIPRKFYAGYSKFNPDYPYHEYKINSSGFRGPDFIAEKPQGIYRIAIVGDSTVFGLGSDESSTFPALLQAGIKEFYGTKDTEVLNLGIPSFTTENMKNLVLGEVLNYSPNMIIVYGFFNDIYYSEAVFKRDAYVVTMLNHFIMDHSVFYLSLREKICKMLKEDIGMLQRGSLDAIARHLASDDTIIKNLTLNLEKIIAAARSHGIKVVLAKQAIYLTDINIKDNGILESDKLKPFYDKVYSAIDSVGMENQVQVIPVNNLFEGMDMAEKDIVFSDGVHLTRKGNQLLASIVLDSIKRDL